MKGLFCGDIVGKSGRRMVLEYIPKLRDRFNLDFVIANGENAAHGFGLTPKMAQDFFNAGIDIITLGNHSFDKKEIFPILDERDDIIRPMNYPENTVGKGFCFKTLSNGYRLAVVQLQGHVFMRSVDSPFESIQSWLEKYPKGGCWDFLIVDFHAEATAEKMGMGHFLDGQACLVVGTHTHIPTADAQILPNGTGYITDIGMCGDYHSVIGMKKETALPRFFCGAHGSRLEPADSEGTFCAVFIEIEEKTGVATKIFPVRIGAHLENTHEI